jgi:hypothetical protein
MFSFADSAATLAVNGAVNVGRTAEIVVLIESGPGGIIGTGGRFTDAASHLRPSGFSSGLLNFGHLPTHHSSSASSSWSYSRGAGIASDDAVPTLSPR